MLSVARNGGADSDDAFAFDDSGASFVDTGTTLTVGGDVIASYSNTGGLLLVTFADNGTAPTTALVNEVLQSLTYTNASTNPPTDVRLDYTLNDGNSGGDQGSGGALSDTGSVTVSITPTNNAPTATDGDGNIDQTRSYDEDPGGNVALDDIVVTDGDGASEVVTATLTLADTAAGSLTTGGGGSYDGGAGVWQITGDVGTVNAALAAVEFAPTANYDADTSISVSIDDGDEDSSGPLTGTITLDVTAQNDAPVFSGLDDTPTFDPAHQYIITDLVGSEGTDTLIHVEFIWFNTGPSRIPVTEFGASNNAPAFVGDGVLDAIDEDTADPSGDTVSNMLSGVFNDIDAGSSLAGILVVGNPADVGTEGVWQYSSDGGANWADIGNVADGSNALAIDVAAHIRFVPAQHFNGVPPQLTVRAVDNSYAGTFSTTTGGIESRVTVNSLANGGTTAIAAGTDGITTAVGAVNDAPDLTGNAALGTISQGSDDPGGSTIDALFGSVFNDVDSGASFSGVAVVGNAANPTMHGTWQYSTNSGTDWHAIGPVGDDATALALSAATLIRFLPAGAFTGNAPVLAVRALDDSYPGGFSTTAGSESRQTVDTSVNGDDTPISAATGTIAQAVADNQTIDGTADADFLLGGVGDDTINGGDGDDIVRGEGGDDFIDAGAGANDQVNYAGFSREYTIIDNNDGTFTVIDSVAGRDGTDTITNAEYFWFKAEAARPAVATYANQTLTGTAGTDFLPGALGADTISGGDGNDFLAGNGGNDMIDGGGGDNDQANFTGFQAEYNVIDNGDTTFTVIDLVANRDGTDILSNVEYLWFNAEGVRPLLSTYADQTLNGTAGSDFLSGARGTDTISGGDGNDFLKGNGGNDTLNGGGGNNDQATYAGSLSEYTISDNGNGSFTIQDSVAGRDGTDTLTNIEYLWFNGDGVRPSLSTYANQTLTGGAGADVLLGANGADTIAGGGGNDFLRGNAGNDFIDGGDGTNDQATFNGSQSEYAITDNHDGTFTIVDSIADRDGTDTLTNIEFLWFNGSGTRPAMSTYADQTITGTNGSDFLVGARGADTISGMEMNDTLVGSGGNDFIDGGNGSQDQANYTGLQSEYVITDNDDGTYTITDTVAGRDGTDTITNVEFLFFIGSGSRPSISFYSNQTIGGTSGQDFLPGGAGEDTISGGEGNDFLIGNGGNDTIDGGGGDNDQANYSGQQSDYLVTDNGAIAVLLDDTATINDIELDALNAGNGNYDGASVVLARIGGAVGDDSFSVQNGGNLNVDPAAGTVSSDGFVFANFTNDTGTFTLTFTDANGTTPTTALVNETLQAISYKNTAASPPAAVDISYTFDDGNSGSQGDGGSGQGLGLITLTIDQAGGSATSIETGTGGDDILVGSDAADLLDGGAGDDQLFGAGGDDDILGGAGNDIIAGGEGADWLYGDEGDDVFVLDGTSGHDTIADFAAGAGSEDRIYAPDFGYTEFDELVSHFAQIGADAVLQVSEETRLTLTNIDVADLHKDDFLI